MPEAGRGRPVTFGGNNGRKTPVLAYPVAPIPLTDADIRSAKPAAKAQKLFDGGGLFLEVSPAGGKGGLKNHVQHV